MRKKNKDQRANDSGKERERNTKIKYKRERERAYVFFKMKLENVTLGVNAVITGDHPPFA